jgi:predicted ribosomally synthesized six-cysteine peptide SCIFF
MRDRHPRRPARSLTLLRKGPRFAAGGATKIALEIRRARGYNILCTAKKEGVFMKHIKTIAKPTLKVTAGKGCGECQTSCQSACKTSCTVANQECENTKRR